MSAADIDEIYEELLQIYNTQYINPKEILSYKIIELMKEGRSRENAILTLYEREGKIAPAEVEVLEEDAIKKKQALEKDIRKKKEDTIRQQIKDHKKSLEKLALLLSKGELDEESYRAAIKPHEEKIAKLEKEKKDEATVKLKRESVELPAPPPTAPTKRLDPKILSKYFIHGFAFSVLFLVMFLVWVFALAILVVSGAIIGLIIGFGLLALIVGYLNSVITDYLWFTTNKEFWNLLFHGCVLFAALLAVDAIIIWAPNRIFPSVEVQIIAFIIGTFVNGLVGKKVAEFW